jgi:hypothetical protein
MRSCISSVKYIHEFFRYLLLWIKSRANRTSTSCVDFIVVDYMTWWVIFNELITFAQCSSHHFRCNNKCSWVQQTYTEVQWTDFSIIRFWIHQNCTLVHVRHRLLRLFHSNHLMKTAYSIQCSMTYVYYEQNVIQQSYVSNQLQLVFLLLTTSKSYSCEIIIRNLSIQIHDDDDSAHSNTKIDVQVSSFFSSLSKKSHDMWTFHIF